MKCATTIVLAIVVGLWGVCPVYADLMEDDNSCEVRYPARAHKIYSKTDYPAVILNNALLATESEYGKCKLVHVGAYSQKRKISSLIRNDGVDVAWLPATKEISKTLRHVSVPIRKGLLGWRLLLVNEEAATKMQDVSSLTELNAFSAGYSADWTDLHVLTNNFGRVITAPNFETLFDMLSYGRFDFFSRALYEAQDEIDYYAKSNPTSNLLIQPTIALHYPQADFYYVNKSNTELHERISKGLEIMLENGTFDALFYEAYQSDIDQARLKSRNIIFLENNELPDDPLLTDTRLWLNPNE